MDGRPLGLGLVVEDKPTEFSCIRESNLSANTGMYPIRDSNLRTCMQQGAQI